MSNPYAPPGDFDRAGERSEKHVRHQSPFYSTAISTIAILQIVSFGLYAVYWFYKHWAVQKRTHGLDIIPLGRAFFAVFFVHRLFRSIKSGARAAGVSPKWDAGAQATVYVMLTLIARIAE